MSHSLRLQDFDGNWHTVGADGISAHLDMATGEITNGQGEVIDPYAPPLQKHDDLAGNGGGGDGRGIGT